MNKFNFLNRWLESSDTQSEHTEAKDVSTQIEANVQPFQLRGLLHALTNKIAEILKKNRHDLYYDVDSEIGRYIIGDNYHIGKVLEFVLPAVCKLSTDSEIILKLYRNEKNRLIFEVSNKKGYINSTQEQKTQKEFDKAVSIAEAMDGQLIRKSSRFFGTTYTLDLPFYEDTQSKSYKDEIKKVLEGKRALFIGKNAYDTKRAQYIFKAYGIEIENMEISLFESKKPDMNRFDMAILRSRDLTPQHIAFFRTMHNNPMSEFKIIIVHELFEAEEKIAISHEIAHAELYNPTVIGDVEEVLYQLFVVKSQAIHQIDNLHTFDAKSFRIKSTLTYKKSGLRKFRGAHIAIVEDSKPNQKVIEHILSLKDIRLFYAENGQEMLDLLKEHEIDMIFTDINMPVMDGLSMAKRIRREKLYKNIPIVAVTSIQFDHELKEMYFAGMNGSIAKPFKENDFYAALEAFLVPTEKMKKRIVKKVNIDFAYNKDILDIEKGIASVGSKSRYKEKLVETMEFLNDSVDILESLIYNKNFIALDKYTRKVLKLYQGIAATEMVYMFKELLQFLEIHQKTYAKEYIKLYQKNWKDLKAEVMQFLKNDKKRKS